VVLFLFCSIDLHVCVCVIAMLFLLLWLCSLIYSCIVIPPVLLFLLKIAFDIQGLSCFHMNFRINFSISIKNDIGILILH
jgi:hypothetical protein